MGPPSGAGGQGTREGFSRGIGYIRPSPAKSGHMHAFRVTLASTNSAGPRCTVLSGSYVCYQTAMIPAPIVGPTEQALVYAGLVLVGALYLTRTALQTLYYLLEVLEKLLGD